MAPRVLFLCTRNSIRSPMAEALAKHLQARGDLGRASFDSAGIDPGFVDGFAVTVMTDLGIDLLRHESKSLEDIDPGSIDMIIALSAPAVSAGRDFVEGQPELYLEEWVVEDPSLTEGSRADQLTAYRRTRDALAGKLRQRFALGRRTTISGLS